MHNQNHLQSSVLTKQEFSEAMAQVKALFEITDRITSSHTQSLLDLTNKYDLCRDALKNCSIMFEAMQARIADLESRVEAIEESEELNCEY